MQTPPTPSLTFMQIVAYAIVASLSAILSSLGTLFTLRFQSKKLPSEIHRTDAEADLARAQAKHFEFQDSLTAGEMMSRIFQQLLAAHKYQDELISKLAAAEKDVSRIPAMEAENKILSAEVERARRAGFLNREDAKPNPAAGSPMVLP